MTLGLREERLDAAIVAFLDELSRDTADAPSTDEMAIRVSGGRASARRSSARWQALLVAAVVVAAAVSALVVGSERLKDRLPPPTDLPPPSAISPDRSPASVGAGWCDLAAVRLEPAHGRPPSKELVEAHPRMAYGSASWVEDVDASRGVVVLQGAGDVTPVTLADVTWPNGRPNATWVSDVAADGSRIALSVAQSSVVSEMRCGDLYVLDAGGSEISTVFRGAAGLVGASVGFSLDGAYLGIVATDERSGQRVNVVRIVTLSGEAAVEPESYPCSELRTAWAPTGHRLAVSCSSGGGDVVVLDVDGGRRSLPGPASPVTAVGWSTDGQSVLVATVDAVDGGALTIHRLDPDGGSPSQVNARSHGLALRAQVAPWDCWAFSPDGRYLVTNALVPSGTSIEGDIHVVDALSGEVTEITDAQIKLGVYYEVGWSIDGSALVMRDWNAGPYDSNPTPLIAMAPDGSGRTEVGFIPRNAFWRTEASP